MKTFEQTKLDNNITIDNGRSQPLSTVGGKFASEEELMTECAEFIQSFQNEHFASKEGRTKAALGFFIRNGFENERAQKLAEAYCEFNERNERKPKNNSTVCCLGPSASFTHLAAMKIFRGDARYELLGEVKEIFECLNARECDFGLIAISNTASGPTDDNIDLLYTHLAKAANPSRNLKDQLTICGEYLLQVEHCLIGGASNLDNLMVVHAHPQEIQQCRVNIDRLEKKLGRKLHIVTEVSTSAAARRAAEDLTGSIGAIANQLTAELLNLNVLHANMQDNVTNTTRFLLVGRQQPNRTGSDRTSIWLRLKDEAGALVNTLKFLSRFNITSLISRPMPDEPNIHSFFIEFEGHMQDETVKSALNTIGRLTVPGPVWLGSYPVCKEQKPKTYPEFGGLSTPSEEHFIDPVLSNAKKTIAKRPPLPRGVSDPLTIGIIGNKGKYGSWFDRFFREKFGYNVLGSDVEVIGTTEEVLGLTKQELVQQSDVVIFAVPLNCMNRVIRECVPFSNSKQLWMDIASVKGTSVPGMLDSEAEVISLHPMSGPDLATWRGQSVNVCPVRCPDWMDWCKAVLKASEAKVEYSGAESHDRLMAVLQAMPHAFYFAAAGVLRSLDVDLSELQRLATPTYSLMWYGMNRFLSNAPELCADIQLENKKFTLDTLDQMLNEIGTLREMVKTGDRPQIIDHMDDARRFVGEDLRIAGTKRFVRLSRINSDLENENSIEIYKVADTVSRDRAEPKEASDRPGLLEEAVRVFGLHGVNMTSLHSEGNTEQGFHFLIGTDDARSSERVQKVIRDLRTLGWSVS